MKNDYDFIFAGGGLAGLMLAYELSQSALPDCSMLIIDRDAKTRNDRTWCFWTTQPTPFERIVQHEWRRIHIIDQNSAHLLDLGDYRYQMIRGIDFYRFMRQALSAHADFIQGKVESIADADGGACVRVNNATFFGRWVFDSRFNFKSFALGLARGHSLRQHFKGWEIETASDAFDPTNATLMDFRTPQKQGLDFFYVLPVSKRRALIEYVSLTLTDWNEALRNYIARELDIRDYEIVATEGGINPLTDYTFPRRAGKHIFNIGTRGGRIKPSTGYAFTRIQKDSAAIVQSLIANGHPFAVPHDSRRYRFLDQLLLDVMQHHGAQVHTIFNALFRNNPIDRVLRLLDEQGSLIENAQMMASVPSPLFLEAMLRILQRSLNFLWLKRNSAELEGIHLEDE